MNLLPLQNRAVCMCPPPFFFGLSHYFKKFAPFKNSVMPMLNFRKVHKFKPLSHDDYGTNTCNRHWTLFSYSKTSASWLLPISGHLFQSKNNVSCDKWVISHLPLRALVKMWNNPYLSTVTIARLRDFNITVIKTTHYHLSGPRIAFNISDISIYPISY